MKHQNPSPLVICFYTLDTPYEQEVIRLVASCKKWGIEHHVEGRPSKGSWEANCNLKPSFILEKLEEFRRPVFWVDADACFLKPPDFTPFLESDIRPLA